MTACRYPESRRLIELIVDRLSWCEWSDESGIGAAVDESIVTGQATVGGHAIALIVSEFAILGGSIGAVAATRIVQALDRAVEERLPVLALPASGGTRMQEGTPTFLRMLPIVAAVRRLRTARLPLIAYLRSPTTGGTLASWASLGQVTLAEPGALVGFLGPRVHEALHGPRLPEGVQTAENLCRCGLIDEVLPAASLREWLLEFFEVLKGSNEAMSNSGETTTFPSGQPRRTWAVVEGSRRPDRVGLCDLLDAAAAATFLNGSGEGDADVAALLALVRFNDAPCVIVGSSRRAGQNWLPLSAAGMRVFRRAIRLATQLQLPLVTFIDTCGGRLSKRDEERGLAHQIAFATADLMEAPIPTLSVLLGQGAGGVALSMLATDRVIAMESSWLAPLPPEAAALLMYKDASRARAAAEQQRVRAQDLLAAGLVDRILGEPDHLQTHELAASIAAAVGDEIRRLATVSLELRLAGRERRWAELLHT